MNLFQPIQFYFLTKKKNKKKTVKYSCLADMATNTVKKIDFIYRKAREVDLH